MSKSIYDEAIADAKKIREAAEANAKSAILEAVTPKIRAFIEQTILEQSEGVHEVVTGAEEEEESSEAELTNDDGGDADAGADDSSAAVNATDESKVTLDESAISTLLSLIGGDEIINSLQADTKGAMNAVVSEALSKLSEDERTKLYDLADKIERNADILESKEINNNVSQKENNDMAKETFYEVDLKSLQQAVNESANATTGELSESDLNELMSMLEQEEEVGMPPGLFDEPEAEELETDDGEEEVEVGEEEEVEVEDSPLPPEIQAAFDEVQEKQAELEEMVASLIGGEAAGLEDVEAEVEDLEGAMAGSEEVVDVEEEEVEVGELEEVYEIDPEMLKRELRNTIRELQEGKGDDSSWGGKGSANAGTKNSYGGKGTGKVGAKRSFGGGAEGKDPFVNPPQMNKLSEALRQQVRLNRGLNEKLGKYRSAVKTLREQLEDLNLFNAKLLYVNKLLQNKGLTEAQRKSVIRALDKASSLNEAKTLYKSLTESFSEKGKTLSESRHRGSSSRATSPGSSKTASSEVGRWAKLAGLK